MEKRLQNLKNILKKDEKWINKNIDYDVLKNFKKDKLNLRNLFYFAGISYYPYQDLKKFIIPDKKNSGLVKYVIFEEGKRINISFRGTKLFKEVINNLKFYRVDFEEIPKDFFGWRRNILKEKCFDKKFIPLLKNKKFEIHKGFKLETYKILKEILELLMKKKYNEINLVGHSLGGSIAFIISILIKMNYPKIKVNVTTISSPPVGSKNFNLLILYYGINYRRIYNYQDFIPHYGYFGSWLESKKFRHLDYMLKGGVRMINLNQVDYQNKYQIGKSKIEILDYGKSLEKFLDKDVNLGYAAHDIYKIDDKKAIFL